MFGHRMWGCRWGLPHSGMDGVEGEKLLGGVDGALSQGAQVGESPGAPFFLVLSCAWRVEAGAELAGAQKVLHFAADEDEVDVVVAVEASCDVDYCVFDVAVPLPRLHAVGDRSRCADVKDGAAYGRVDVV